MRKSILFIAGICVSSLAWSNPDVTSREYKLLLDPSNFTYATESSKVDNYFDDLVTAVEAAISRDVTGSLSLDTTRTVKFYDKSGSCDLKNLGYIFRDRIESGNSEVTLKFRSPDRYISDFEDLSATSNQAETKLEADIGVKGTNTFNVVYSHSTTSPNTRTINEFADINYHFPGFNSDYGFSDSTPLSLVGNLSINERVYKGGEIDLGSIDAEVSVTLWYTSSSPSSATHPAIVEVSFKYEDSSADYTKAVVNRAKTTFEALQGLTAWNSTSSTTKTEFVYSYNPGFCN